ncbi:MAG: prohibitin family protein [Chloroflexi bacterium]|nr:prohibitin family protein [Chloroflexota bacterium]
MDIADFIKAVSTFAWLLTIGLVVLAIARASRGKPIKQASTIVVVVGIFSLLLTIVGFGLVFLQADERGVVVSPYVSQGYRPEPLGPGLHWIIPGETVTRYTISKQTYTMSISQNEGDVYGDDSITARTSDGQEIFVDSSVIFSVDPGRIIDVHIAWQDRYIDELVRPQVRGIIRDAVSQYGVEEVVSTKRAELTDSITTALETKLEENGLILVDFVLRNITFSEEYSNSAEQKQIAEQLALQAELIVEQKRQEAEQARQEAQGLADAVVIAAEGAAEARVIEAEAEAEALRLIAAALENNPSLLQYQYITKLAPDVKVILMPTGAQFILPPELIAP